MDSRTPFPCKISTSIPGLYLRTPEVTQHDAEGLTLIFSHKFNNRFEPERPNRKDPDAAHYLNTIPKWREGAEKGQNAFCLVARSPASGAEEDDIVGFGGINGISTDANPHGEGEVRKANVGVMIHEPFTGKGYGKAAMYATIDAAFNVFHADVVEAETFEINTPFRGLMSKLKLDQFSTLRQADHGGEAYFWITKADWDNVK